jgi:hypothetical protein
VRSQPSTTASVAGTLPAGSPTPAISRTLGADQKVWFELESGGWVRSDIVTAYGEDCTTLPEFGVAPTTAPTATTSAPQPTETPQTAGTATTTVLGSPKAGIWGITTGSFSGEYLNEGPGDPSCAEVMAYQLADHETGRLKLSFYAGEALAYLFDRPEAQIYTSPQGQSYPLESPADLIANDLPAALAGTTGPNAVALDTVSSTTISGRWILGGVNGGGTCGIDFQMQWSSQS